LIGAEDSNAMRVYSCAGHTRAAVMVFAA